MGSAEWEAMADAFSAVRLKRSNDSFSMEKVSAIWITANYHANLASTGRPFIFPLAVHHLLSFLSSIRRLTLADLKLHPFVTTMLQRHKIINWFFTLSELHYFLFHRNDEQTNDLQLSLRLFAPIEPSYCCRPWESMAERSREEIMKRFRSSHHSH